jgi:hypothetical protein
MTHRAKDTLPEPIRNGLGGTILGPRNVSLELENPDLHWHKGSLLWRP